MAAHGTTVEWQGYGAVLLDQRRGKYWQLNPAGALLLQAFQDGTGVDGAVRALTERYGIGADRAREDVTALLARLREAGLVAS